MTRGARLALEDVRSCLRGLRPAAERVLEAGDGREALVLARSGVVHVVLADVVMPGLDGLALCRAIKSDPEHRHVAVLLISGEENRPPDDAGADGFLPKPFNARQLVRAVERLVARVQPDGPERDPS